MITLSDGRNELWQWDTNRKLNVDADCSQVHFSNKVYGRSIDVDVVNGTVFIPDILLQTDKDLYVWAFVGTPENGHTKISKIFKVNRRNKPADYVFTPVDQLTLEEIKEIAESVREDADNGLFKGEKGDPFTYEDFTSEQLAALKGDPGYTPVKGVDYFDGKDGVSVTHSWSGTTLTVTSASGTSSADLKGVKGDKGDAFTYEDFTAAQLAELKGKDGHTPVKGVDYTDGLDGIGIVNITSTKPAPDTEGNYGSTLRISTARPDGTDSKQYSFWVQHGRDGAKGDKGDKPNVFSSTYTTAKSTPGGEHFIPSSTVDTTAKDVNVGDLIVTQEGKLYLSHSTSAYGAAQVKCELLADLNGKDGKDYVLTDADKTEIAEQAAELVDVPENVVQADWNAAEGEPGHVLNRTHYHQKQILLPETKVIFGSGGVQDDRADVPFVSLVVGESYTVNWNGREYITQARDLSATTGIESYGLGNLGSLSGNNMEETGEPFIMEFAPLFKVGLCMTADGSYGSENTVSIVKETLCKLPGKFLPDGAVRADVAQTLTEEQKALARANIGFDVGEPAEDDIPKVFISGTIPTTKNDVLAELQYISKTENFSAFLKIKCQGNSSMSYPKKNFTIKLYSDEARDSKLKKTFKDWGHASNKYVLKANYIDHSHARNIVSARLWDEVVASRENYSSLPAEMRNSPCNGAIDGFPVKLYANGTYQGIYTWNIGKDDWMWGMDEDNANHVLLCGETNTDGVYAENACNFRALWSGTDGNHWSVEVGTNREAVKNSLNALISCVMNTDDETFKATIGNYMDVQSAIDYYLHMYVICGIDGLAKNMLLATYNGTKWICGAYDMDSTFGLWWEGNKFVSAQYRCPEDYQEKYSLLWERIASQFSEEIKTRYAELRKTVYSYSNMVTHFERFTDTIGKDLYAEDLEVYTGIPSGSTNNIKQIRDYIRDRLAYVDDCIMNTAPSIDGYTVVSYIESDGNQYIDTGISGGENAAYEIKLNTLGTSIGEWRHYFAGGSGETVPKILFSYGSRIWAQYPSVSDAYFDLSAMMDGQDHTVRYDATANLYLDSAEIPFGKSTEEQAGMGWGDLSWYVFSNPVEPNLMARMRLYYLKMYTNGELVRDFVPVQRNSDGVYGLFDRVTNTFFGNAGSGAFTGA